MPHKNPRCKLCHSKTVHHKWLEPILYEYRRRIDNQTWKREVKCPYCGEIGIDWKTRTAKAIKSDSLRKDE